MFLDYLFLLYFAVHPRRETLSIFMASNFFSIYRAYMGKNSSGYPEHAPVLLNTRKIGVAVVSRPVGYRHCELTHVEAVSSTHIRPSLPLAAAWLSLRLWAACEARPSEVPAFVVTCRGCRFPAHPA